MAQLLLFNKPYRVLSQFRDHDGRSTLADYIPLAGVYCAGRLDYDSEGLLLLTDSGTLQTRIAHPRHKMVKHYLVQVEGSIDAPALARLREGVVLQDGPARALDARAIDPPELWPRHPPIRQRRQQPTSWIALQIDEGRNRQVRRMTAAVGFPTLRLVRWRVGPWSLDELAPGSFRCQPIHAAALQPRRRHRDRKQSTRPTHNGPRRRR